MIPLRYRFTWILVATLVQALPVSADGTAAALYKSGTLAVEVAGPDVSMQLRLPMTRADASTAGTQSLTVEEVVARLKATTARASSIFP